MVKEEERNEYYRKSISREKKIWRDKTLKEEDVNMRTKKDRRMVGVRRGKIRNCRVIFTEDVAREKRKTKRK